MKYKVALLADFRTSKTVYIADVSEAQPQGKGSTRLSYLFVVDPVSEIENMITVVVKGMAVPAQFIEELVAAFFARREQSSGPFYLEIDDNDLPSPHASRSKMNSTFMTSPPNAI